MTQVAVDDNGRMAAVFAPLDEVERILKTINGYVVIANINSDHQAVIGGASKAVEQAMEALPESRLQRGAVAGQPRLPHVDCGAGQRAAAASAASACICNRRVCRSWRTLTASFIPRGLMSCRRCWIFSRSRSLLPCSS